MGILNNHLVWYICVSSLWFFSEKRTWRQTIFKSNEGMPSSALGTRAIRWFNLLLFWFFSFLPVIYPFIWTIKYGFVKCLLGSVVYNCRVAKEFFPLGGAQAPVLLWWQEEKWFVRWISAAKACWFKCTTLSSQLRAKTESSTTSSLLRFWLSVALQDILTAGNTDPRPGCSVQRCKPDFWIPDLPSLS